MAKQTLKHRIGDEVFTRQTARDYKFVVVGQYNATKALARLGDKDKRVSRVVADAVRDFEHDRHIVETGVGNLGYFHPHQGGAYMNKRGKHMTVNQWDYDRAVKNLEKGQISYIAEQVEEYLDGRRRDEEALSKGTSKAEVLAWSSRAALADKAQSQFEGMYDTWVEAVNNGQ